MRFKEKTITLKNGQTCLLRSPEERDAEAMLDYLRQTSAETDFMLRYEDEITLTPDDERKSLSDILDDPKRIMIAAFIDGKLVANTGLNPFGQTDRVRHRAEFGISIIKEYWGQGIGSALLSELIAAAKQAGYEQLELEVVTQNERGIALYKKLGFETFGTREHTFKYRDGRYCACHLMLRRL